MGREDKAPQSPDEEYMPEFTGEQTGESYGAEQGTSPHFSQEEMESMKPGIHPAVRKIGIMLGLIVAIIVVMWYLRHQEKERYIAQTAGTAPSSQQAAKKPAEAAPVMSANLPTTPTAPALVAAPTNAAVPSNPALNAPTPNVQTIPASDQETTTKINELTTQVHNLADAMSKLSQSVQTLETKVAGMAQAPVVEKTPVLAPVQKITVPRVAQRHHRHMASNAQRMKTPVQSMDIENAAGTPYVVRGIVPRRAWIDGPYNSFFTVTVGDVIPGLGKVIRINAPAGEVVTSGGKIEYGDDGH